MRGKLRILSDRDARRGLIPAHAGKTYSQDRISGYLEAHPRACGENPNTRTGLLIQKGSSPRMRGKHRTAGCSATGKGLIPAHAGKTHIRRIRPELPGAHPRACGEN